MRTALAAIALVVSAGGALARDKVAVRCSLDSEYRQGHATSVEVRHSDVQFDGHSPRRV